MIQIKERTASWRALLKSVYAIICAVSVLTLTSYQVLAHGEHGSAPDLEIRSGETDDGDLYFRLTIDHGKEVNGPLNGPIHIHSGRPHLIRFVNEGEIDHEVHFGQRPDLEARLYGLNLFGPGKGKHSAHGFLGVHIKPGESAILHIWIPEGKEGEWEIACFIPGHYEMGQRAPIHVISDGGDNHSHMNDLSAGTEERHDDTKEERGHHDEGGSEKHHHD